MAWSRKRAIFFTEEEDRALRIGDHRRWRVSGESWGGVRVALFDEGKVLRAAASWGATAKLDRDTNDLAGRSSILVVEVRSATGGLVVDEIAVY